VSLDLRHLLARGPQKDSGKSRVKERTGVVIMRSPVRARILVVSDSASRGEREDRSGAAVRARLVAVGWEVAGLEIVADDEEMIRLQLKEWTDAGDCDVVFTVGGTGLGPRDVTPEATMAVVKKRVPGLEELMRAEGGKKTRRAALARGVVGVRHGKMVVNLPGSERGATETLEAILDLLPHAIELLHGKTEHA
jgi:molybdenum cofactor synthesis domain-containing protein